MRLDKCNKIKVGLDHIYVLWWLILEKGREKKGQKEKSPRIRQELKESNPDIKVRPK